MRPDTSGLEMEGELHQILTVMQFSFTKIDGIIDALSYWMDRMSEHINKHAEHLDMVERRVDKQVIASGMQKQLEKVLTTLQAKAEDLEAHSQLNNTHIVGLAEFTNIGNMTTFVE
ncbi:hypothetical protein NDU88_005915 [Pleurodeles waltl]|uniref:Uncharacterized protein n=1 Tax=Pleurodeles waltl TaxID=8319 RepID=A0AAV7LMK6_PLEWA|nr:hypothetical protein NDU88_005915 [Pleurodeles waltl]